MRTPTDYFGTVGQVKRPCEACNKPIKIDNNNPAIYGGGRFCSQLCSKFRTYDRYIEWLQENPEEYKKHLEEKGEIEKEVDRSLFDRDISL